MARKRSIKPSFNDDDDIVALSDSARLLYAMLWGHQDRNGVMEDSILSIRSKIYPREERPTEEIAKYLDELTRPGPSGKPRLYRFKYRGKGYLYCPTMPVHQKIYSDESACIQITKSELQAIISGFEKTQKSLDAAQQLGTETGDRRPPEQSSDGDVTENGRPPEHSQAFPSSSALASASAPAFTPTGRDELEKAGVNNSGNGPVGSCEFCGDEGELFAEENTESRLTMHFRCCCPAGSLRSDPKLPWKLSYREHYKVVKSRTPA